MSKVFADDLKEKEEQLKKLKKDLEQKETNQTDDLYDLPKYKYSSFLIYQKIP